MTNDTLPLNELAPYLAYNLEFITDKGRWILESCNKGGWTVEGRKAMYIEQINTQSIKPLVIPLSELTKPELFIPILSAVNPLPFQGSNRHKWKAEISEQKYLTVSNKWNDWSFQIDLTNCDLTTYRCESLETTDNMVAYINELYKQHIDIHNWIDRGIALNKLTVLAERKWE